MDHPPASIDPLPASRPPTRLAGNRRVASAPTPFLGVPRGRNGSAQPGILFYARGETIFERGTVPTGMYFVIDGAVQLVAEGADGRDKVVELFGPGEMFGEIGVFIQSPYQATAQAVGRTTLIHVARAEVLAAVARDGELAARMLREVSRRVEKLITGIRGSSSNHAGDRVANYLLQLPAGGEDNTRRVTLPAPKGTVASLLGLTPETLSRIMRRFCDDGLIVMKGRSVFIPDVARLQALRCSD